MPCYARPEGGRAFDVPDLLSLWLPWGGNTAVPFSHSMTGREQLRPVKQTGGRGMNARMFPHRDGTPLRYPR
jgi:hypothetical protein